MTTSQCAVYMDGTHSAIVLERGATHVTFIPLSSLAVEKAALKAFDAVYVQYPDYPVRRAAEVYLRAGDYRPIPPQTREHLKRIVADPATAYTTFETTQPTEEGKTKMASTKPTATAKTAAAARNGMSSVTEAVTKAPKGKPAAKAAPATPAEALKAAVKGKPAPAKTAPAAKAAPEPKGKPAAKAAAPVAAKGKPAAAAEGAKPRNRIAEDVKYKVIDTSRVKRGFLAEFVAKAQSLKVFTREKLEAEFATRGGDTRTYFPYAVGKGIFGLA